MAGVLAYLDDQPAWVIFLGSLCALGTMMIVAAAFENWRAARLRSRQTRREVGYDATGVYDKKLAELRADARAKEQFRREELAERHGLFSTRSISKVFSDMDEEHEAKRLGRLQRLREGKDK